jgi:hypothetical protein
MGIEQFVSLQPMSDVMKDSVKGLCVMKWFHVEKDQPHKFFYKNTINEEMPFSVIDLRKSRQVGRPTKNVEITKPYNEPPNIKTPKYKNLLDLVQFIPPIHHTFYQELSHTGNQRNMTMEAENSDNGEERDNLFESDYE